MPRPRTAASPRRNDGIAAPERLPSGRWRYRVWDSEVRSYLRSSFVRRDGPGEPDAGRRIPGCADGDAWARSEQARVRLGLSSARVTTLESLGAAYIAHREAQERSGVHVAALRFTVAWAVGLGVSSLDDKRLVPLLQRGLRDATAMRPRQKEATPSSPRSKNKRIAILRALGSYGVKRGFLVRNPFLALDTYSEAKRHRKVYSIEELRMVVSDAARDRDILERDKLEIMLAQHGGDKRAVAALLKVHPSTVFNRLRRKPAPDAWWLFIALAAYTGMRSETIRLLTWSMVDWKANRLRVPAEITKTNADIRVPLQPELADILRALGPGIGMANILPTDLAGIDSDGANQRTQAYLRRNGIEPAGRSVHSFRHTTVALLTATGLSHFAVMDSAGHSSTQTSKHYAAMADDFRDLVRTEGWPEGEFYLRRPAPNAARMAGSG